MNTIEKNSQFLSMTDLHERHRGSRGRPSGPTNNANEIGLSEHKNGKTGIKRAIVITVGLEIAASARILKSDRVDVLIDSTNQMWLITRLPNRENGDVRGFKVLEGSKHLLIIKFQRYPGMPHVKARTIIGKADICIDAHGILFSAKSVNIDYLPE